jgi:hypothetical protein
VCALATATTTIVLSSRVARLGFSDGRSMSLSGRQTTSRWSESEVRSKFAKLKMHRSAIYLFSKRPHYK